MALDPNILAELYAPLHARAEAIAAGIVWKTPRASNGGPGRNSPRAITLRDANDFANNLGMSPKQRMAAGFPA